MSRPAGGSREGTRPRGRWRGSPSRSSRRRLVRSRHSRPKSKAAVCVRTIVRLAELHSMSLFAAVYILSMQIRGKVVQVAGAVQFCKLANL